MQKDKILIVDDDKSVLASLLILFRHHDFEPIIESDPKKIKGLLNEFEFQAVILDMNFRRGYNDGKEGLHWLDSIKINKPNLNVVLITAYGDIDLAVDAVKKGASDFILKPWDNNALVEKVKSVIEAKKSKENRKTELSFNNEIIGNSNSIKNAKKIVEKVSKSPVSIMICGENGVGKMLFAKFINYKYTNSNSPLIIDFSKPTIDFNVIKTQNKVYILKDLNLITNNLYDKLIHFIETNQKSQWITTLINKTQINFLPVEIISQLSLINIELSPLRVNKDDIELFSNYFLNFFSEKYNRKANKFHEESLKLLYNHDWFQNISELKFIIERAVILSDEEIIKPDCLKFDKNENNKEVQSISTLNLLELEKEAIIKAIDENNGNITKAAKILGITRTALYRRMEKHDL